MVEKKADPNVKYKNGVSLLNYVSSKNCQKIAEYLIEEGANTNEKTNDFCLDYESPILNASYQGNNEMVERLMKKGLSISVLDSKGYSSLYHGSRTSDFENILFLIQKGCKDYDGSLLSLCKSNNNKIPIEKILEMKANPNVKDHFKKSALYYSAFHSNLHHLRALVESGAKDLDEALSISSVTSKNQEIMEYLINTGECNLDVSLFSICKSSSKNLSLLQFLLDKGASVNSLDSNGKTPLYYASYNLNLPFMKEIVERRPNEISFSLLGVCRSNESFALDVASFLISHDADPNFKDKTGKSCLFYACKNNNFPLIDLLVEKGSKDLETCLYYASNANQQALVIKLLDCGADPHQQVLVII